MVFLQDKCCIFEGLGMEKSGIFYRYLVHFYGNLVHFYDQLVYIYGHWYIHTFQIWYMYAPKNLATLGPWHPKAIFFRTINCLEARPCLTGEPTFFFLSLSEQMMKNFLIISGEKG
jgi:hypothetical protein